MANRIILCLKGGEPIGLEGILGLGNQLSSAPRCAVGRRLHCEGTAAIF